MINADIDRLDHASVGTLVHQLTADAREFAQAEYEVTKAKTLEKVGRYQKAAVFFVAAAVLALSAITAMLVGLILTLTTLVGPGWATLLVVAVTFLVAGVLAMIGKGKLTAKVLR